MAPYWGLGCLSATGGRISPYTVFNRQPKIVAIRVRL